MTPDPKPPARVVADREGWEQLRRLKLAPCRVCRESWLPQLHHLVSRSHGGDDVPDNLVPLCRTHHQAVEEHHLNTRALLRLRLTTSELAYVDRKMGMAWFDRMYPPAFACPDPESEWIRDMQESL